MTLKNFNKTDYLCFTANTAGSTIQLVKNGNPTEVSLEILADGSTWSDYTIGDTIILTNIGDKVYRRNKSETDTGFSTGSSSYYQFVMSGSISASGDINYLLNKNSTTIVSSNCFCKLFNGCPILSAPSLPATSLANSCYYGMFRGCTNLTTAPSLPATSLATSCYSNMFNGCSSLTTAPELPATSLTNFCYNGMFQSCTSLTTAPSLPATTLAEQCYRGMFYGCTSLTTVLSLPATSLADYCYYAMFSGCTNLKLSTTQDSDYTQEYRIPVIGTGTEGNSSLSYMFTNTGGTFTGDATINTTYYLHKDNIIV